MAKPTNVRSLGSPRIDRDQDSSLKNKAQSCGALIKLEGLLVIVVSWSKVRIAIFRRLQTHNNIRNEIYLGRGTKRTQVFHTGIAYIIHPGQHKRCDLFANIESDCLLWHGLWRFQEGKIVHYQFVYAEANESMVCSFVCIKTISLNNPVIC